MTVAICLASSGLWQGWCPTCARVPHRFHHHCNVVGTVGREESYFEKETSQGSVYHQEGVPMQVRKLVDCVWMALLLLLYFVDVSFRRKMAVCQFSPEVSLREEIAVDYATVVTSQPTHPLDCPHHSPCHSWNLHQFIAEQSSLLYFFCQVDCQGIVVFLFHNILTQHLVHKNSIRLIAYYLFITQIHEKVFDENLVLTLKATFLKFIHSRSSTKGRHKTGYAPRKALF